MDPLVLTSLIIACAVQSLVIAFLSATVPFLWWKAFRLAKYAKGVHREVTEEEMNRKTETDTLRSDLREIDEVIDALCKAAGMAREDVKT